MNQTTDITKFYKENREELEMIIHWITHIHDPDQLEDLVSEVVLHILRYNALGRYKPSEGLFQVYMFSVIKRKLKSIYGKRSQIDLKNYDSFVETHKVTPDWTDALLGELSLKKVKAQLTEKELRVLDLRESGLKGREICEVMEISLMSECHIRQSIRKKIRALFNEKTS